MYFDYLVDIPKVKEKITFRSKGSACYVYYRWVNETKICI